MMWNPRCQRLLIWSGCFAMAATSAAAELTRDAREFFESRIRPVLVDRCYRCHSGDSKPLGGQLRLDWKGGWERGGESGFPAIVPGNPDRSPLIQAVRRTDPDTAMPPEEAPLSAAAIADLEEWVRRGAPDPRTSPTAAQASPAEWEAVYRQRLSWWSLQPLRSTPVPVVRHPAWLAEPVDRHILAGLEKHHLEPAPRASKRVLARRLSFALLGLPATPELSDSYELDPSPAAWERLVDRVLANPHFGEHWARHWMDVVHYADTHGYEWDAPAKNAWEYRDYLVRAFNGDLPIDRFLMEQVAGDLLEPRLDQTLKINESLIGPMALRLGERRHGDSAAVEGVTQEAMAIIVDTFGKGLWATTLACAQCHDHKLDPIEQRDYYALTGIWMSTRWGVRCLDVGEPNAPVVEELRRRKATLRGEIAKLWRAAGEHLRAQLRALPAEQQPATTFPTTLVGFWQRSLKNPVTAAEFATERSQRQAANAKNLRVLADFRPGGNPHGWRWDGSGMRLGLVTAGEPVIAEEGSQAISQILAAGRYSHVWSQQLAGSLASPQFDPLNPVVFSLGVRGGRHAAHSFIVDQAFHSERMKFLQQEAPGWLTATAGEFDTLEGSLDRVARRTHFELVTKALNNYFPPRTGYGGLKDADAADPRSWFGVTQVVAHPRGQPPQDELARFAPLFAEEPATSGASTPPTPWLDRIAELVLAAVGRWADGTCSDEDALLLDEAVRAKLLPNEASPGSPLAGLLEQYRAAAARLVPDRTIGSAADWQEGRNERLAVRGTYTDLSEEVPRGLPRVWSGLASAPPPGTSGRLALAHALVSPDNPLVARAFVNRVWLYLFGEGLVRTPDDFGRLGETPSHPELLDDLVLRFTAQQWSLKRLVRQLVMSATWQQASQPAPEALAQDPENRLWHHLPMRRLEAESLRDAMLLVSGRFDAAFGGPPLDPHRTAEDAAKRLFSGPVDGRGRRSVYTKVTLMEPPRLLAIFNQPLPKLTCGRRDATHVPAQALTLLNDPLVLDLAKHWSEQVRQDGARSVGDRLERMFLAALGRAPRAEERERLQQFAGRSAALRGVTSGDESLLLASPEIWQDVAHAMFNLKEFIYVP